MVDDATYARAVRARADLMELVVSFAPRLSPEQLAWVVHLVEVNEPDVAITELAWMLESAGFVPDAKQAAEFRRWAGPEFVAEGDLPPRYLQD